MSKEFLFLGEKGSGREKFIDLLLGCPVTIGSSFSDPDYITIITALEEDGVFVSEQYEHTFRPVFSPNDIATLSFTEFVTVSLSSHPLLKSGVSLWIAPPINSTNHNSLIQLGVFLSERKEFNQIYYFLSDKPSETTLQFLKTQKQMIRDYLTVVINISENNKYVWDKHKISEIKSTIKNRIGNVVIETVNYSKLYHWFITNSIPFLKENFSKDSLSLYRKRMQHSPTMRVKFRNETEGGELFEEIEKFAGEGYILEISNNISNHDNIITKDGSDNFQRGYELLFGASDRIELKTAVELIVGYPTTDPFQRLLQAICLLFYLSDKVKTTRAIEILSELAYDNDASAIYLGLLYYHGIVVEKNDQQSFRFVKIAAGMDNLKALNLIGEYYRDSIGTFEDSKQAFRYFQRASEYNLPEAMRNLGLCFRNGYGTIIDEKTAFQLIEKSASEGDTIGQYELAACYSEGIGTSVDFNSAFEWYLKAAEKGNTCAQNDVGFCYEEGKGVEKNNSKAFEYYQLAAFKDLPEACFNLAECYRKGIGTDKNHSKAQYWYKKADELGDVDAVEYLDNL